MASWKFYGRTDQLAELSEMLGRDRWFKGHVGRFLDIMPRYQSWTIQHVGISPLLNDDQRAVLVRHHVIPQDLDDLTSDLK